MRPNQMAIRTGAAARGVGLGEGCCGDSPSTWASVKLRFRAFTARSAARWGNVAAYGAERIRSDSRIVILYIGDIKYQSGEGRLSDEVVNQLGEGPIAEDELPSPATVSSLSRKSIKACINIVMHAFVDFLKPYDGGGSTRLIPVCSTMLSLWRNAQSPFCLSG